MTMKSFNMNKKNTILGLTFTGLFSGIILVSSLLISTVSCTDVEGDGADSLWWEGVTLPDESGYRNPIWEPDLSNPSVFRGATQFFAFGDEKEWAPGLNYVVPVIRSGNLMNWSLSGEAFLAGKPTWAMGPVTSVSGIFAKTLGTYYLAYTIEDEGIGIAYSKTPQGPYSDYGKIIDPESIGVTYCRHPYFIQAGLKFYMFFENTDGIYGLEMNVVKNSTPGIKGDIFKIAGADYTGTYIFRKESDAYYFFGTSGEGDAAGIKMALASDIKGPYLDREGNNILNGFGTELVAGNVAANFIVPSHVGGIFTDYEDREWIIYQVTDTRTPALLTGAERHPIMLSRLDLDDQGWPVAVINAKGGWHQPKFIMSE
jgi:arabinan endo-1,5-alpha-L-arabinosidase